MGEGSGALSIVKIGSQSKAPKNIEIVGANRWILGVFRSQRRWNRTPHIDHHFSLSIGLLRMIGAPSKDPKEHGKMQRSMERGYEN